MICSSWTPVQHHSIVIVSASNKNFKTWLLYTAFSDLRMSLSLSLVYFAQYCIDIAIVGHRKRVTWNDKIEKYVVVLQREIYLNGRYELICLFSSLFLMMN